MEVGPSAAAGIRAGICSNVIPCFQPKAPPSNACLKCRYVYERVAAAHLGKSSGRLGLLGAGEWLRAKGHAIRSQFAAAQGALQLVALQEQARRDAVDSAALGEAALEEYMRQRMGKACLHQAIPFCMIDSLLHGGTICAIGWSSSTRCMHGWEFKSLCHCFVRVNTLSLY